MPSFITLDTSVLTRLTKATPDSVAYQTIIGDREIAISFQVRPEVLSAAFVPTRQRLLDALLDSITILPHSEAADVCYAETALVRKAMKRRREVGSDAADADVWIIASAIEHGLPLLSHDKQQVALARAMKVATVTNLPRYRDANPTLR